MLSLDFVRKAQKYSTWKVRRGTSRHRYIFKRILPHRYPLAVVRRQTLHPIKAVSISSGSRCNIGQQRPALRSRIQLEFVSLDMYTQERPNVTSPSITPRPTLGRSQLIHLGRPPHELLVLALFVRMSFRLATTLNQHLACTWYMLVLPRISRADNTTQTDIG